MKISSNKDGKNTVLSDVKVFTESLFDVDDELCRYKQSVLGYNDCFVCNIAGKNIGLCKVPNGGYYMSLLNNNEPLYLIFVDKKLLDYDTQTIYDNIRSIYDIIFHILEYDKLTVYINISDIFTLYTMTSYFNNVSWEDTFNNIKNKDSNIKFLHDKDVFGKMCKYTVEELYCDNKILDFI